jgi:hypothetical protein
MKLTRPSFDDWSYFGKELKSWKPSCKRVVQSIARTSLMSARDAVNSCNQLMDLEKQYDNELKLAEAEFQRLSQKQGN